eukprot:5028236-Prymnesium_polylepis.1
MAVRLHVRALAAPWGVARSVERGVTKRRKRPRGVRREPGPGRGAARVCARLATRAARTAARVCARCAEAQGPRCAEAGGSARGCYDT